MLVISVPLSETIVLGFPLRAMTASSSRASRRRERRVGDQRQVFAGEVADDGQDPKATTIREGVTDEIQAPALVGTRGQRQRASRPQNPFAPTTFAHRQLLFAIETPQFLQVHDDALPTQHDMDAASRAFPFYSGSYPQDLK